MTTVANRYARLWGIAPKHQVEGRCTGISAALWGGANTGVVERTASPEPDTHILGICVAIEELDCFADGRLIKSGRWRPWAPQLMLSGVQPRSVVRGRWEVLHIYLPANFVASIADVAPGSLELIDPTGRQDARLAGLAQQLLREMHSPTPVSRIEADSLGLAVAGQLLRNWSNLAPSPERVQGGLAPSVLRRVTEFFTTQLDQDVGLADAADVAGLSTKHFARAFRQSTGLPPHQWLIQQRGERAKQLMAGQRASLSDVALACGFADQSHFTAVFRKSTGTTPGSWQRQHAG